MRCCAPSRSTGTCPPTPSSDNSQRPPGRSLALPMRRPGAHGQPYPHPTGSQGTGRRILADDRADDGAGIPPASIHSDGEVGKREPFPGLAERKSPHVGHGRASAEASTGIILIILIELIERPRLLSRGIWWVIHGDSDPAVPAGGPAGWWVLGDDESHHGSRLALQASHLHIEPGEDEGLPRPVEGHVSHIRHWQPPSLTPRVFAPLEQPHQERRDVVEQPPDPPHVPCLSRERHDRTGPRQPG